MINDNIQLSEHFKLGEFTNSTTAKLLKIDNTPGQHDVDNLEILCKHLLEPLRLAVNEPIFINSGYRSQELNKAVGGVSNSYHLKGMAADIRIDKRDKGRYYALQLLNMQYCDLVILERHKERYWVHVQWSYTPRHKYLEKNVK